MILLVMVCSHSSGTGEALRHARSVTEEILLALSAVRGVGLGLVVTGTAQVAFRGACTVRIGGIVDENSSSGFACLALGLTCTRLVVTARAAEAGVLVRGIFTGNALAARGRTDFRHESRRTISAN